MIGERVFSEAVGPIRTAINAEGAALALFSPKFQNTLIRLALAAGGRMWLRVFLPKRFSAYAVSIGYRVSQRWQMEKRVILGSAVPFLGFTPPGGGPVHPRWKQKNGEKMINAALNGANVRVTATATRSRLVFTIPYGHAVRPETSDMFRTVPSWEVDRIAETVAKHLQDTLDGLLPAQAVEGQPAPRLVPSASRSVRAGGLGSRSTGAGSGRRVA